MTIYLADPFKGQEIHDLDIKANEPFPANTSLDECRALHRQAAEEIVEKMRASLPQGTLVQVFSLLLEEMAPLFSIPMPKKEQKS